MISKLATYSATFVPKLAASACEPFSTPFLRRWVQSEHLPKPKLMEGYSWCRMAGITRREGWNSKGRVFMFFYLKFFILWTLVENSRKSFPFVGTWNNIYWFLSIARCFSFYLHLFRNIIYILSYKEIKYLMRWCIYITPNGYRR